jgi:soluble lytic murein transglycosylase-like protein
MRRPATVFLFAALLALPAGAGKVEIAVREDGVRVMRNEPDAARSRRLAASLVRVPDPATVELIDHWSLERDLDPRLVRAVMQVESGYNPRALSDKGAMGLMQLMPDTARDLEVGDPWDPEQNVRGGTAYLRRMLDRFGDLELALAAYNAGPETVVQYAGVPPFEQTRSYVHQVLCLLDGTCESAPRLEGRRVRIERGPDNKIRLTTSGLGG